MFTLISKYTPDIEKMSIAEIDNKLGPFCLNKISKFGKTSLVYFKKHT